MTVVLDSWAVLRYLEGADPAASRVDRLLRRERPITSWINLGEVFYVLHRRFDDAVATTTVRDLREVTDVELPDEEVVLAAARILADHPLAYADAFAAATAIHHDATLWTGDDELLGSGTPWRWRDLR